MASLQKLWICLLGFFQAGAACSQQPAPLVCTLQTKEINLKSAFFPYDLNAPVRIIELPDILREASGLSASADGRSIWAVQDERGSLFSVSLDAGKVREFPFGSAGDYEGVEVVDGQVYVVLSSGTICQLEEKAGKFQVKAVFDTFLEEKNNVEGLGYDPVRKLLLVACKGIPGKRGTDTGNKKAVYGFEVKNGRMMPNPLLCISGKSLAPWASLKDLPADLDEWFNPSGIAVHPQTGEWYILSAKNGNLLRVAPDTGEIRGISSIRSKLLEQPEGICFDHSGRLLIATEGKERSAQLLVFEKIH